MRNRRIAKVLSLATAISTLMVTAACTSQSSGTSSAMPAASPNTVDVTLPTGTTPGWFTLNVNLPLSAAAVGDAEGDKARLAHLTAEGVSVSVVPIVDGKAASPLTGALVSTQFAPNPGTSGTWKVGTGAASLRAARMVGSRKTSGTFSYSSKGSCEGANGAEGCGGRLSIRVTAELSDAGAARLAARFAEKPDSLAIAFGDSTGHFTYVPTAGTGGGDASGRRLTLRLDPAVEVPAAPPTQALPFLDSVVDTAFAPISARVRPAALASTRPSARSAFADATTAPRVVPAQSTQASSGCGSVMTAGSTGLDYATGFLSVVPVVGTALSAVTVIGSGATALMGANAGDACIQAQFELINAQLADQEGQIQNLQVQYALEQNEIYQLMVAGANAETNLDLTNYNNAIQAISPSDNGGAGIFGNFMKNLGFWNSNYSAIPGASIAGSSSGQTFLTTVSASTSEAPTFASSLNSLSGSAVDVMACSTTACPRSAVTTNPSSSLISLWSSEAQQLEATATLTRSQVANVVPLFDQYNNTIVEQFQNSLGVLQQAFSLEAMVNQLNYDHATTDCSWGQSKECTNIDSFGGVPGTWYGYCQTLTDGACPSTSTATETTAYNQAQYRLAQVYAWRTSLLFETTLSFLFTDPPISPQAYPTTTASGTIAGRTITSGPVPYATTIGSALTGIGGIDAASPMASLPAAVNSGGATWQMNAALYQYSGIFDANGCANVIMAANEAGGANAPPPAVPCPPAIFLTGQGGPVDQSSYTGNVLQPYTNIGGSVVLAGLLQANLLMCNPSAASLGWYTPPAQNTGNAAGLVLGGWYLNCGNWATITNATYCFPGASCPLGWSDPVSGDPWLESQYYSWSSPSTSAGFQMNFETSPESVNFSGVSGCGTTDAVFFASGASGVNYNVSSSPCYLSMTVLNSNSMNGVTGLQTTNQGGSGNGLQIPIMWSQSQSSKDYSNWSWEPQQVPSSQIGSYGFTCSGQTCTMVDGSQWTVTWSAASNDPGCPDCIAEEVLNLGLSQVS